MNPKNHNDFILSPITAILEDVISASSGIGFGIEVYPLCDYVMQSVFLKMTGSQEQKMKCICWEFATYDYGYRYDRYTRKRLGECSTYSEKREVYKDLIRQIKKHSSTTFNLSYLNKNSILSKVKDSVENVFNNTNLLNWTQKSYDEYLLIWGGVSQTFFATDENNLFAELSGGQYSLKKMYETHLYTHRNKIAHNTLSYQQNLPTLRTLIQEEYKYENYFIFFSILILIDEVFRELYKKYLNALESF